MTRRFHLMKLVENIGVKNPLLTNNSSYPRIKKKIMFCEISNQYLDANIITCLPWLHIKKFKMLGN